MVVIGSGFGGSVAALRLVEKGYSVAVLEAGRRFADHEFAETSWRVRRFLWAPALGCFGIQRIDVLPGQRRRRRRAGALRRRGRRRQPGLRQHPLRAAGRSSSTTRSGATSPTGGPSWRRTTTRPAGCSASRPTTGHAGRPRMRTVAERMGVGDTFHPAPVGVFLGEPGVGVPDPYFGGAGPGAHRLPALRLVHDRVPARRQEHAGEELPVPGRAGRRAGAAADHGHGGAAGGRRRVRVDTVRTGAWPRPGPAHHRGRPGDLRRGGARHPAAAAPDAPLGQAGPTCRPGSAR